MAPSTTSTAASLSEEIDELLEHYLELLDQYTALRSQLSGLQSSVHQHISRANFSAERSIRYGADFYDARMQATRVCRITVPTLDGDISTASRAQQEQHAGREALGDVEQSTAATSTHGVAANSTIATVSGDDSEKPEGLKGKGVGTACFTISTAARRAHEPDGLAQADVDSEKTKTSLGTKDPLRMFGLLTPPSLRLAQAESIKTVEEIVPKLVTVDTEMQEVEIRIRRARKHKAKAEALESKEGVGEKGTVETERRREVMA